MEPNREAAAPLALVETVRCLDCGELYAKPVAGGTVRRNPGCPACGYVGWLPVTAPTGPRVRLHFGAGLQRSRSARSG
jgi:hypothetical protein